ncbi:hypothetical protein JCM13991_07400 [Thermodesulfovibrio hydrogeniphilus]
MVRKYFVTKFECTSFIKTKVRIYNVPKNGGISGYSSFHLVYWLKIKGISDARLSCQL